MSILINYEDLENRGFDGAGGEILYYQGQPFTGFCIGHYSNGNVSYEEEYKSGYKEGIMKDYYENGQNREECFIKYNRFYSSYKLWDINGNLIKHLLFNDSGDIIETLIG